MIEQSNAVPYLGRNAQGHFFCTAFGLNPSDAFTRHFSLTIDEAKAEEASE